MNISNWTYFKHAWKLTFDAMCERIGQYFTGIQMWILCIRELCSAFLGFVFGIFMIFLMPLWIIFQFLYMPFHIFFFRKTKLKERYAFHLQREEYYKKVWGDRA